MVVTTGPLVAWLQRLTPRVDLLAFRFSSGYCPSGPWIRSKHTHAFAEILLRMRRARVAWSCVSEGFVRLSDSLLVAFEDQVRHRVYSFAESMLQPIAWATNHTYSIET